MRVHDSIYQSFPLLLMPKLVVRFEAKSTSNGFITCAWTWLLLYYMTACMFPEAKQEYNKQHDCHG